MLGFGQKLTLNIFSYANRTQFSSNSHAPCRPAPSYYFPTLHQLKFEVEDGTTPNARPVRFGYNSQEFPNFSWKGYAVMSPAQVCTYLHWYLDIFDTLM